MGTIRIGPAGWSYEDWVGIVYPKRRPQGFHEATYLANYFDTIELNVTFYRPIPAATATEWIGRVAHNARFVFTAKLWQEFTHSRDLTAANEKAFRPAMKVLRDAGKLGALLAQFPWSFKNDAYNLDYLRKLVERFLDFPMVVEVRHSSWDKQEVYEWLAEHRVGFCNIDQPIIGPSLKPGQHTTAPVGYPSRHGMTLWLLDQNQKHYRLTDTFSPAFYVSGSEDGIHQLQAALERKPEAMSTRLTERIDLWKNQAREVLEVSVRCPTELVGWGRWVHGFNSKLQLYNSDLMVASLYCWEKKIFPLARVEVEVDAEGALQAIECRDDEWAIGYELPPLKVMHIRLAGLSRIDPNHRQRAALEIEVDGQCWELNESDDPPAVGFANLVKREDPDIILSDWGDATILPLLLQQAERLRISIPLNRDSAVPVHQSRARSYMSYGRILFKNSSTTLFGRLHIDKQNSFISEKCDCTGLWELARITKLPVQYAARTTTGTGISYMQMELAHRDGVLIPEQKAEPEDPKQPDELLCADRGGLVFVPKIGFFANVAELDFVSQFPSIMARFNISPETVNCPCCPDSDRVPELGYHVCQKRRGIPHALHRYWPVRVQ